MANINEFASIPASVDVASTPVQVSEEIYGTTTSSVSVVSRNESFVDINLMQI